MCRVLEEPPADLPRLLSDRPLWLGPEPTVLIAGWLPGIGLINNRSPNNTKPESLGHNTGHCCVSVIRFSAKPAT